MTDLAARWPLDPGIVFLNHGSFGACPAEVMRHQAALRAEMEAEPVRFLSRELDDRLDEARGALAAFLGALAAGDELLTTDHAYNACRNALEFVAQRSGARVVIAPVPFPVASPDAVVEA